MTENQWQLVTELQDGFEAEIIKGLLESQGLRVHLSQEGAGRAYGITVGPLGVVQILVPTEDFEKAKTLVDEYYEGEE